MNLGGSTKRTPLTQRGWFIPFVLVLVAITASVLATATIKYSSGDDKPTADAPRYGQTAPPANAKTVSARDVPYGCEFTPDVDNSQTGTVDANDPLCGNKISDDERYALVRYRTYYQKEPAFNCADGRNNGKGFNDQNSFDPCPNGSLHVTITNGLMQLVNATGPVTVTNETDLATRTRTKPSSGWTLWMGRQHNDPPKTNDDDTVTTNPTYRLISYDRADEIQPFMAFERKDGGPWTVSINTNDHAFYDGSVYEVLFTWSNPNAANVPAPLPSSFNWACLPNNLYGEPRTC